VVVIVIYVLSVFALINDDAFLRPATFDTVLEVICENLLDLFVFIALLLLLLILQVLIFEFTAHVEWLVLDESRSF